MSLNKKLKNILWEYDLSELNLDDAIVVQRILMLGEKEQTDYWIQKIGKNKAKKLFLKIENKLDKKSANYWNIVFNVEKNNFKNNKTMYEKLNKPIFTRSFR